VTTTCCLFLAIEFIAYPGEVHVGVEDYIWGSRDIPDGNGAGRPVYAFHPVVLMLGFPALAKPRGPINRSKLGWGI